MNTLEIIFTGIVYLLGTADGNGGRVVAVLPAVTAPVAPYGAIIPAHTAYIKVEKSYLVDPKPTPTFKYTTPAEPNKEYWVFALGIRPEPAGDAITIRPSNPQPDKLTICRIDPCDHNRLRYDRLVAHREEICPKCGPIEEAFRDSPLAELVAARMVIEHGYLAAAKRAVGDWDTWLIKPAHGFPIPKKQQQLTEQVSLDLASDDPFSIVVTALDDAANVRYDIRLAATAKVEIGNTPAGDIVLPPHSHQEPIDHHFGLFYTMLQSPVPTYPPVPISPEPHDTLGPRDNCPPLADEQGKP
jgi:hypothetical protein